MAFRAKDKDKHPLPLCSYSKDKASNSILAKAKYLLYIFLFFSLWLFLLFLCFPPSPDLTPSSATAGGAGGGEDDVPRPPERCDPDIAPFYMYDLPTRFNLALLRRCRSLNIYTDMCPHVAHRGLGQSIRHPLSSSGGDAAIPSWYATHQFIAEMIFHARAERHPCRTLDPSSAILFYVPFYAGLYTSSVFRESDHALQDALAVDLAAHISSHAAFRGRRSRDHFPALGRTAWDLMRSDAASSFSVSSAQQQQDGYLHRRRLVEVEGGGRPSVGRGRGGGEGRRGRRGTVGGKKIMMLRGYYYFSMKLANFY